MFVKTENVDLEPCLAGSGQRDGAEGEDDHGGADQRPGFFRWQFADQALDQEEDDGHRAGEDNLLRIGEIRNPDGDCKCDEGEPAAESVRRLEALGVGSLVFDPCMNRRQSGDFLDVMRANVEALAPAFE